MLGQGIANERVYEHGKASAMTHEPGNHAREASAGKRNLVHRNRVRPDRSVVHPTEGQPSESTTQIDSERERPSALVRISKIDVRMEAFDRDRADTARNTHSASPLPPRARAPKPFPTKRIRSELAPRAPVGRRPPL